MLLQHIKHNFTLIFEKLMRNSICYEVYYRTSQYATFKSRIYLALFEFCAVSSTRMHETSTIESFKLLSRAIHATNNCLLPMDNRGRLIQLHSSSDSMNLLQRCSHAVNSSIAFNRTVCSVKSRSICIYIFFTINK